MWCGSVDSWGFGEALRCIVCVQALHRVLKGLPSTLALANGHSAALEATDELRQVMSATDARRLDKLFRLVSKDDSSCTGLRAVLGPIFL